MAPSPRTQGLAEYVAVVTLLTIVAVGALALFRDPVRAWFGDPPARAVRNSRTAPPAAPSR